MPPGVRFVAVALWAALASSFAGRPVTLLPAPTPAPVALPAADPSPPLEPPARPPAAWAEALPALRFHNTNTGADGVFRLYAGDGSIDEAAASELFGVLAELRAPAVRPVNRRLLRLVVKAAHHFHATEVTVVSAWREPVRKGSRHGSGEALDFSLPGASPLALAAYLRTQARVGVGVYTNRRTQFVHLDVREQSYHWVDASPPGRVWRETALPDRSAAARDANYRPEQDLP